MKYINNTDRLGEENIIKLIIKFSLPTVVGLMIITLYNVCDRIFIGKSMGEVGIASISLVFPLFMMIAGVGMLFGIGGGNVASIKLGEKKNDQAEKLLGNVFFIYLLVGLFVYVFGMIFLDQLLYLLGASEQTFPHAKAYTKYILMSTVFMSCSMGLNNFIRAEGNPKIAMLTMFIGAIINLILDPIFIFGMGMGIKGAGLATLIANIFSAFWNIWHLSAGKRSTLKIRIENFKLDIALLKEAVQVGLSPFIIQISFGIVIILYNNILLKYGGDTAISVMGVINTIMTITILPINGINSGSQPIMGYNYGAKKYRRVKEAFFYSAIIATTLSVFGFIIIELFPGLFISMLSKKGEVGLFLVGKPAIRIFFISNLIVGYQVVGANYFQVTGRPNYSIFLNLTRTPSPFLSLVKEMKKLNKRIEESEK